MPISPSQQEEVASQLRKALTLAGETPEYIAEAEQLWEDYARVMLASYQRPEPLVAGIRYALADQHRRKEQTHKQLAAEHGTSPELVSSVARNITYALGLGLVGPEHDVPEVHALLKGMRLNPQLLARRPRTVEDSCALRVLRYQAEKLLEALAPPPHEQGEPFEGPADAITFRFKVTLEQEKSVWRELELRGDQTLRELHSAIQEAFGWDDTQLWCFCFGKGLRDVRADYGPPALADVHSADVPLARFNFREGDTFGYIYDLRTHIPHTLVVTGRGTPDPRARYPREVARRGQVPPEEELD